MEKDGEAAIRLKVKDLSVKSVLKLLLGARGLTAAYRDGAIVILPKEDLQARPRCGSSTSGLCMVKIQDFAGPVVELTGPSSKKTCITGSSTSRTPSRVIDDDFLLQTIKASTGTGTWDSNPNAVAELHNGQLVVTQTPAVLREIENLLTCWASTSRASPD